MKQSIIIFSAFSKKTERLTPTHAYCFFLLEELCRLASDLDTSEGILSSSDGFEKGSGEHSVIELISTIFIGM